MKQTFTLIKTAFTLLSILVILPVLGNNVRLGSSVRIVEVGASDATIEVSVSWSNSWRDSYNNDAVWVFFKYRTASSGWSSVLLPESASVASGYTSLPGYSSGDVVGYFVYRSSAGSGDASTTFRFKWSYPSSLDRTMFESNQVFLMAQGVEMVYIPYGSYTLGDGSSNLSFSNGSGGGIDITSNDGALPGLPASNFPNGYEGFYLMKYELSQEQYVSFINSLSRSEQLELLPQLSSLHKGDYIFGDSRKPSFRNGIVVSVPQTDTKAAVLDNNLSGDAAFGGQDDGRTLACNYLSPLDLLGYMSWSGLRPMTELEYEKSCRRLLPYSTTPKDYAWGTTSISSMSGIDDATSGWSDESPNDGCTNAEGRFGTYPGKGPVRCGAFASIASGRESAGSTYAGVMEMSGNVGELCLNISASDFDGWLHGSGSYYSGEWGSFLPSAFGLRGGSFASPKEQLRISDRSSAQSNYFMSLSQRDSTVGFRGVRMLSRTELGFTPGEVLYNNQQSAVVCSGSAFRISNLKDGGSAILSGLQVTYKWFVNGKELPNETGNSLSFPGGIYNTSPGDSVYRFTRRVFCSLGELETDAVTITVPGKLELSLPAGTGQLRLACNTTSAVTASRLSDTRFRWVNGSSGKVIKDWSRAALTDSYSPLHSDFGYMGALRKLRCVSDVNGCRDSVEVPLTIESSCSLVVDSSRLHMSTNTNGGTAVASLCGPGSVKWYYKDNGGVEHLISSATATATTPAGSTTPLSYTVSYKPKYSDFKNTIGERTLVIRSQLGDDSRCTDTQELTVSVQATLDPGEVSVPALACSNAEITINNDKNAGVDGMSGLLPVYSWYVNGSSTPLPNENGPTLKYRLPSNTTNRAVAHTFVRKAATGAPALQSQSGATALVTVPGVPEVSITAPAAACDNTNLSLVAPAINWAGLEGQGAWSLNGSVVPSPVRYSHNGQELRYTISNTCHSSVKSNGVAITVYPPTVITTQPVGQTLCQGGTISLSVGATGRDLKYQWLKGGSPISGATSAFYSKGGVLPGDGGAYSCLVSGTCNTITTTVVTVTVHATTAVSAQPQAQTLCQGGTITLSTAAVGNALFYQWQKNGGNIGTGTSYTKGSAVPSDGGNYRCVISGTCGSATSNTVAVTVNASTVITSQPVGQTICQNQTISLSTAASGTNISYQWQKNGGNIGGATGSSYSKGGAVPGDGGNYRCVVSGSCGAATSSSADVIVRPAFNAGVIASTGETICYNTVPSQTIGSSTNASGGDGTISYQWYQGGTAISGATGATYKPTMALTANTVFTRKAKDNTCNTTLTQSSGSWTVTVRPNFSPGSISGNQTICYNTAPSAIGQGSLPSGGDGSYSYRWLSNGSVISGATSASYSPGALTSTTTFTRQVMNGCNGWIASGGSYVVTVNAPVVNGGSIAASASSVCTNASFNVNNSVDASVTCAMSITGYEWFRNNTSIGWGTTIPAQALGDGTYSFYRRAYTYGNYYANSNTVTVTVASCRPPTTIVNGKEWTIEDVCTSCNWYEAKTACSNIGMRLPNDDDWTFLHEGLGVPMFDNYYWSASEYSDGRVCYWNWTGRSWQIWGFSYDRYVIRRVRCVK